MSFSLNNPLRRWCIEVAKHLSVSTERLRGLTEVANESSRLCKQSKRPLRTLVKHHSLESDDKSDSDSDLPTTASCNDIIGIMEESKDQAQPRKTVKFIHCSSSTSDLEEEVGRPTLTHTEEEEDDDYYSRHFFRRGSGGTARRPFGRSNRSRSVIMRLSVPRSSPTLTRRMAEADFDNIVPADHENRDQASPEARQRSYTYSHAPKDGASDSAQSPLTKSLGDKASQVPEDSGMGVDEDDEGTLPSPTVTRASLSFTSRRNSFLYGNDTDDSPPPSSGHALSRTSSSGSHNVYNDATYVTPFAQILANLHHVRNEFIALTRLSSQCEDRRCASRLAMVNEMNEEQYKAAAKSTLDELDWCLHKLETVNSAKSMGTMAQDKFRRLLSRELTTLSEKSKSGLAVAEWVHTLTGSTQDRSEEIDHVLSSINVVQTRKGLDPRSRSASTTDPLPRFGISGPGVAEDKLEEFSKTHINTWNFDSFYLTNISGGRPLVAASYAIFSQRGLFMEFRISKTLFINFVTAIENNYLPSNPYHNSTHAADVLHATNILLRARALEGIFTNLEILAALIAAIIHDVDHPGRNNQFLINSGHELAIMYNDESVLESHHLAVAFKLLQDPDCRFLNNLEPAQSKALRKMVIDVVLATDMTKHLQHLGELKTMVETKKVANDGILILDKYSDRSEVLQCLVHCADLSNPAKSEEIASNWAHRIMEESFRQGDEEKKLGIDVTPMGDRDNVCVAKCQVSFIDFIVYPLWETWAELVFPDAQLILQYLSRTREYWNGLVPTSPPPSDNGQKKYDELLEKKEADAGKDGKDKQEAKKEAGKDGEESQKAKKEDDAGKDDKNNQETKKEADAGKDDKDDQEAKKEADTGIDDKDDQKAKKEADAGKDGKDDQEAKKEADAGKDGKDSQKAKETELDSPGGSPGLMGVSAVGSDRRNSFRDSHTNPCNQQIYQDSRIEEEN